MNSTLTPEEQLRNIESRLPNAEALAVAEEAFAAASPEATDNPWAGSVQKRDELRSRAEDLRKLLKGQKLTEAHRKLCDLQERLAEADAVRKQADEALRLLNEHETVRRYREGAAVSIRYGWGWSWEKFRKWYESGRERFQGVSEDACYFMDASCPRALQFNAGKDREVILRWVDATGSSNVALVLWNALASQIAQLLREHPELKATG